MARNPRRQDEQLQALYEELPHINCAGFCHDSCGPIQVSIREQDRMEKMAGVELTCGLGPTCSMLTPDRRCGVYEIRPLICRLWGLTESMPCPYGCKPERVVPDDEAMMMIFRSLQIGGRPTNLQEKTERDIQKQMRLLGEEELRRRACSIASQVLRRPTIDGRHKLARSIFEK